MPIIYSESNIIYFEKNDDKNFYNSSNIYKEYMQNTNPKTNKSTITNLLYTDFENMIFKDIFQTYDSVEFKFNINMYDLIDNTLISLKTIYQNLKFKYNFFILKEHKKKKIITFLMKRILSFINLNVLIIKKVYKFILINFIYLNIILNKFIYIYNNINKILFYIFEKNIETKIIKVKKNNFNIFNYNYVENFDVCYFNNSYYYIYLNFFYNNYFLLNTSKILIDFESKINLYSIYLDENKYIEFNFNDYLYLYLFPSIISCNLYNFNNFEFNMLYNSKTLLIK